MKTLWLSHTEKMCGKSDSGKGWWSASHQASEVCTACSEGGATAACASVQQHEVTQCFRLQPWWRHAVCGRVWGRISCSPCLLLMFTSTRLKPPASSSCNTVSFLLNRSHKLPNCVNCVWTEHIYHTQPPPGALSYTILYRSLWVSTCTCKATSSCNILITALAPSSTSSEMIQFTRVLLMISLHTMFYRQMENIYYRFMCLLTFDLHLISVTCKNSLAQTHFV